MANYNQMAQIIKDSAGVTQQEIADSTRVTLPSGLGSTTGTTNTTQSTGTNNTSQAIDGSSTVTPPSELNVQSKVPILTRTGRRKPPRTDSIGTTNDSTETDGGESGGTQNSTGAFDVVSDFEYYKNKLDQDGTSALIKNKYESQVKQTATESARYVAENINKGNQSMEQTAYVAAQTADKFGWSGGYALDAARQVEYLRASIQADIFSQQELQKLGYKSNLEAAYASAELELNEQAQNNYYQAQQMAINQATLTGQYIDPAIADMCIQASAASAIMNREGIDKTSPEYQKAQKVYDYMVANLNARGGYTENNKGQITPVAIQTLADIQMEMEKLNFEQAKIQVLNSIVESGGIALPVIGDDGQIISWTSSPSAAINENLAKFYQSQPDAFTSKVNELMTNMSTGYKSWLQMKDANGNLVNDGKSFEEFLKTAYKNPSALTDLLSLVGPSQNSYTQGDLTVTKDDNGNWTVTMGGTTGGTTEGGEVDAEVSNTVSNIVSNNYITDEQKLADVKKAIGNNGLSSLTPEQQKEFIDLEKSEYGMKTNSKFIAGGTVSIKSKYDKVDGLITLTFFTAGTDYYMSDTEVGKLLNERGIPEGAGVTLDDFKVNGQAIMYDDRVYVWSDASQKFLKTCNYDDADLLKKALKGSIYDMGQKYSQTQEQTMTPEQTGAYHRAQAAQQNNQQSVDASTGVVLPLGLAAAPGYNGSGSTGSTGTPATSGGKQIFANSIK